MTDGIEIPIQTDEAIKAINALNKSLKDFGSKADKELGDFAKSQKAAFDGISSGFGALKAIAAGAVAIFAGKEVLGFFGDAVDAAAKEEQAMARLTTALELTGEGGKAASDEMAALADELEKTTRFSGEQELASLALAKSFGISNQQAQDLTKAANDLASATGQDLESATRQLGLAFSGNTGKLDELVPAIKGLTTEQLKAGEATRVIQERFAGAAAGEIKTFSGAIQQAENAFGDLQKSIGRIITSNPAVITAIESLSTVFRSLTGSVDSNKDNIGGFVSGIVNELLSAGPNLVRGIGAIVDAFKVLTETNPLTALNDTTSKAASLTIDLADDVLVAVKAYVELSKAVRTLSTYLAAVAASVAHPLTDFSSDFVKAVKDINDAGELQLDKIRAIQAELAKHGKGPADGITTSAKEATTATEKLAQQLENLLVESKKTAAEGGKAGDKFSKALRDPVTDAKALEAELKKLHEELTKTSGDAAAQAQADFDSQKETIQRGHDELGAAYKTYEEDLLAATNIANKKIESANQESLAKQEADLKKSADERKALLDSIAQNPANIVKPLINGDAVDNEAIAVAVGSAISQGVLNGKEGARKLISNTIGGVVGTVFGDQIGGIVSQILYLLAGDPKVTSAFVVSFVEAIPQILENIERAIPAIIGSLVNDLINKGGLIRLAVGILSAIFYLPLYEEVAKQFGRAVGIHTGDAFKGPQFRASVAKLFRQAGTFLLEGINQKGLDIFQGKIFDAGQAFHNNIGDAGAVFKEQIAGIGQQFRDSLDEAGRSLGLNAIASIDDGIAGFGQKMIASLTDANVADFTTGLGTNMGNGFIQRLRDGIDELINRGRNIGYGLFQRIDEQLDYFRNLGAKIAEGFKDNFSVSTGGSGGYIQREASKVGLGLTGESLGLTQFKRPGGSVIGDAPGIGSSSDHAYFGTNDYSYSGGSQDSQTLEVLRAIFDLLSTGQLKSSIKINERTFADLILNLSRNNARLSA